MKFYRFISGHSGIYEAADQDCPRDDVRRKDKPDGSWLPKVVRHCPGAISFWTEVGLEKYLRSGLQDWHRRVVKEPLIIHVAAVSNPLYRDELQVICKYNDAIVHQNISWADFAIEKANGKILEKVVAYITRTDRGRKELLVFDHEKRWSEAGTQVPAGTAEGSESLDSALLREVEEESGLRSLRVIRKVDEYILYRALHQQFNRRHVFELNSEECLPDQWDQWDHRVTGHGEDTDMTFHYFWLPIEDAVARLSGGLGDSLNL